MPLPIPLPDPPPQPSLPCDGCVILVLAAGRGTRMGSPKALMSVSGEPWWTRQRCELTKLGGDIKWIVSSDVYAGMERSRDLACPIDRVAVDSAAPMFHSVLAGILARGTAYGAVQSGHRANDSHGHPMDVFILPIDVPAPRPDTWHQLRFDPLIPPSKTSPRVPTYKGKRGHPVFLPASWLTSVLLPQMPDLSSWNPQQSDPITRTLLEQFRLDTLIEASRTLVSVDDSSILTNLNTPDDVQAWLRTSANGTVK